MSSSNKWQFYPLDSLPHADMHKLWSLVHRENFLTFKNGSIISSQVINLSHVKESHQNIGHFIKAQDLSIMFHLYVLEVFEDPIRMFYANLHHSPDSGELETHILGTHIILNGFLFE